MIADLIRFVRMIKWSEWSMLRGMEIIVTHHSLGKNTYQIRIYRWTDLFHFYIDARYLHWLVPALKKVRYLYIEIPYPRYIGSYFYFLPLGWAILFGRSIRKAWMAPAHFFYTRGLLDITPGSLVPLLWFFRIRTRGKRRLGG